MKNTTSTYAVVTTSATTFPSNQVLLASWNLRLDNQVSVRPLVAGMSPVE